MIVKDMSRAGRDYLQTGFYTEVFFRQHGVHFIAIANGVDSEDLNSNEFAPFLNIMNEWYLRDQSRKVSAAYKIKGTSKIPGTYFAVVRVCSQRSGDSGSPFTQVRNLERVRVIME